MSRNVLTCSNTAYRNYGKRTQRPKVQHRHTGITQYITVQSTNLHYLHKEQDLLAPRKEVRLMVSDLIINKHRTLTPKRRVRVTYESQPAYRLPRNEFP